MMQPSVHLSTHAATFTVLYFQGVREHTDLLTGSLHLLRRDPLQALNLRRDWSLASGLPYSLSSNNALIKKQMCSLLQAFSCSDEDRISETQAEHAFSCFLPPPPNIHLHNFLQIKK